MGMGWEPFGYTSRMSLDIDMVKYCAELVRDFSCMMFSKVLELYWFEHRCTE